MFLVLYNVFEIMNSVGVCSPLNKLSVESKYTEIGFQDQKLSLFFRGSVVLNSEIPGEIRKFRGSWNLRISSRKGCLVWAI